MRKLVLPIVVVFALAFAGTALAVESYGGPRYWYPGEGASSSWKSGWYRTTFNKQSSGFDTTVTFIDNVSYAWHSTVRNRDALTATLWWSSQVKKAHCKSHTGYHWGGCHVMD
ncbi:MAG TPA: hypothetical protein VFU99_02555 [Gaiellaceae bacterium]|nr:hypothetical protein [Gaiellaceae bacterium]